MSTKSANRDLEKTLIEGIRSGDERAFEQVFLKYYALLSSVAADYVGCYDTGKEIAHEVLASLWERGGDWNPQGPLKPYLCQAAIKKSIDVVRKERRRREMMQRYSVLVDHAEDTPDRQMDDSELNRNIWSAVCKMSQKRYMVFLLHKRYELSYKEIALVMEISIKTVENHMGSALKYIRKELSRHYSEQ